MLDDDRIVSVSVIALAVVFITLISTCSGLICQESMYKRNIIEKCLELDNPPSECVQMFELKSEDISED